MINKLVLSYIGVYIFLSMNSFSQPWSEQTSGVTSPLTSVSAISGQYAWICGYDGKVLRTTNGGINWAIVSSSPIPTNISLINILAIDANTALVSGYIGTNTYVYRTTNAGVNWSQVFFQSNGFINAIGKITSGLFMSGDPVAGRWSFWKSTNNGSSWDSAGLYLQAASGSEAGYNNSMYCYNSKIWLGTNNFKVYHSSNSGVNWAAQVTGTEQNSYAIWMASQISGPDGLTGGINMYKTTNEGSSWLPITTIGTAPITGITGAAVLVDNVTLPVILFTREDTKIYYATYGGSNWVIDYTAPAGVYRHITSVNMAGPFWAVRNNGGISYHAQLVGINMISSEVPEAFVLEQNYPNPFNPSTAIRFSIPDNSFVQLIVYNSVGMEIEILVNENMGEGVYEYIWNASKYTSGIYFCRLLVKDFSETKKMVLIK
jgi:hypothetical protein